jgi:hypothetical protein
LLIVFFYRVMDGAVQFGGNRYQNIIHAQRKTRIRCRSRAEPFGRAHDEAWRSERHPFGMSDCKSQMAKLKSEICDLKFLAQRGQGTGACVRSGGLVPRSLSQRNNPG